MDNNNIDWERKYGERIKEHVKVAENYREKLFSVLAEVLEMLGGERDGEKILFGEFIFKEKEYVIRRRDE